MLADMHPVPLLIEFIAGTRLCSRSRFFHRPAPLLGNGPPGTLCSSRWPHSPAADRPGVVESDDESGAARVSFGGMVFMVGQGRQFGIPPRQRFGRRRSLSPERGLRMTLETSMVSGWCSPMARRVRPGAGADELG